MEYIIGILFSSPCQKHQGIFLLYSLWEPSQLLQLNVTILWDCPNDGVNLEFLRLVHTDLGPLLPGHRFLQALMPTERCSFDPLLR